MNTHAGSTVNRQSAADTDEETLQLRAGELAQVPSAVLKTEDYIDVVTFMLAYETYGIPINHVREVYPLKDLTPLPCTPSFVAGIINVRGEVLSVVDLKKFFDLPVQGLTDLNKVIIISDGIMEFGILADAILEVITVAREDIQSGLPTLTGVREDYLLGITPDRMIILDAAGLLTDPKIIVREEVA